MPILKLFFQAGKLGELCRNASVKYGVTHPGHGHMFVSLINAAVLPVHAQQRGMQMETTTVLNNFELQQEEQTGGV